MNLFNVQPVFLVTDVLLYLLIALVSVYVFHARRKVHLATQWRQLSHSTAAMISGAVLIVYLAIALADSIHFRPLLKQAELDVPTYSTEVLSVLDVALNPLRTSGEKTYSAPFSTYSFSKETITLADGSISREYPRLKQAGTHLDNPNERAGDIALSIIKSILIGLLICLPGVLLYRFTRKTANITSGNATKTKGHVFWLTLACIVVLISVLRELSIGYHVLGTDKIGADVLFQSVKSVRTGIMIGALTTLIMLPFGIALGVAAGYFRGWVDDVIQYLYTTLSSIPSVLLIAAAILMLQVYLNNNADQYNSLVERGDMRLFFLCLILGITSWTSLCRYIRAETLKLRELDYVAAARVQGASHFKILTQHILPNVMHIVLITIALDFSGLVLAEAVLAYVQIGVDPSTESWGNMISSARLEMAREPVIWWSLVGAFTFMFTLVLAANIFADAVRDVLDPRSGSGNTNTSGNTDKSDNTDTNANSNTGGE